MKLSCLPISLDEALFTGEWTLPEWFEFARGLGLDGADVSIAHLESHKVPALLRLRRQAGMAGVKIAMLVTDCDFTHPDPDERARQHEQLHLDIETASLLGAPFLRVTAGQMRPGLARADGIDWAVEGLSSQLDFARQMGVRLVYENCSTGYGWHCDDFSQPAAIFLEIVKRTADSGLRVLFDPANLYAAGDDDLTVMNEIIDRIAVVRAADIKCSGQYEPVMLGTGVVPLQTMFHRLHIHGFDGWISIKEASQTGCDGFQAATSYCRRAWAASA